jgi:gamma-glutamyltranspeptidase/glutathione hydrolase
MVTSPHGLATEAGAAVLREGGNAVEAAIAVAAVLSVTYPHFCGIGGDAVWMLADNEGRRNCLLGIGQAAASADRIASISERGPMSALTTACAVDSWGAAREYSAANWQGTASLARLLEPAIGYARDGFRMAASQAFWLDFRMDEAIHWPGFAKLFAPGDLRDGIFRQAALACSLESIARHGTREFYDGALGDRIAAGLAAVGAPITAGDLADTRTRSVPPLSLDYGEMELLAPPPPTQGVTTLQTMGILDRLGARRYPAGSPEYYHCCVEAIKRAFRDRNSIGDPDEAGVPVERWLSDEHLTAQAAEIDMAAALAWPQPFRTGDTVFFAAADSQGRCASVLQSTYYDWGSGVVAGDTGILWQNRGGAFNLIEGHPNRLRPGKRPFYTLNPGIALKDGKPHLLYGTQGADGQPQTLSVILSLLLDHGYAPEQALQMPRFLLGKTFSDSRDTLKIEGDAALSTVAGLKALGHEVSPIPARSPLAGQAGVIRIDGSGNMDGANDPRSDGVAVGIS